MHGLIFVTWEKYLNERFGGDLLTAYRAATGASSERGALVTRFYDDAALQAGVATAARLTGLAQDTLLREYGRYFILNGLTGHLCKYILSGVNSGYDLLLMMRDVHSRLRKTATGLTPPLFNYEFAPERSMVILIYDSPRKLCAVLQGAIEGAAERYGEQVQVRETSCMRRGATLCRFEAVFYHPATSDRLRSEQARANFFEQQKQETMMPDLANRILALLPTSDQGEAGMTLEQIRLALTSTPGYHRSWLRPAIVLQTIRHLQFAGYVASTSGQPGDDLMNRRYWRVDTYWEDDERGRPGEPAR